MKKLLMLAGAALLFAAPAFAQTEMHTTEKGANGAQKKTEVDVRSNGTMKVETTERTGRTKAGEKINDAAQDTKEVGKDVAHGTKHVGQKVAHGTKKAGKAVGHTVKKGANKVEDAVD